MQNLVMSSSHAHYKLRQDTRNVCLNQQAEYIQILHVECNNVLWEHMRANRISNV